MITRYLTIAIIAALILGGIVYGQQRYNAGYNQARQDYTDAQNAAIDSAVKYADAQLKVAIQRRREEQERAANTIRQLREQLEAVSDEQIEQVVVTTDCADLGDDFKRLFNTISAGAVTRF